MDGQRRIALAFTVREHSLRSGLTPSRLLQGGSTGLNRYQGTGRLKPSVEGQKAGGILCTCVREIPHKRAACLAVPFPPCTSCKFLDLPPASLRNLQARLTENSLASQPPLLCGISLEIKQRLRILRSRCFIDYRRAFALRAIATAANITHTAARPISRALEPAGRGPRSRGVSSPPLGWFSSYMSVTELNRLSM